MRRDADLLRQRQRALAAIEALGFAKSAGLGPRASDESESRLCQRATNDFETMFPYPRGAAGDAKLRWLLAQRTATVCSGIEKRELDQMLEINDVRNPFPGLRPFETDENNLFFGCDGQSDELLERLRRARIIAVVVTLVLVTSAL